MRTLLVDDNRVFLSGLRHLLDACGFQVVGTAEDALEARVKARVLRPELILMDLQMPGPCVAEAVCRIKSELPSVRVVMLSLCGYDDQLIPSLRCGASGYLLKSQVGPGLRAMFRGLGMPASLPHTPAH